MTNFDNNGHALKRLHARTADIHDGCRTVVASTGNMDVAVFFGELRRIHERHMVQLDRLMLSRHLRPSGTGAWATLSHAGMMAFRRIPDRLDGWVIDAAIRSERTLLDLYDEALEAVCGDGDARAVLLAQKDEILCAIVPDEQIAQAA